MVLLLGDLEVWGVYCCDLLTASDLGLEYYRILGGLVPCLVWEFASGLCVVFLHK